MRVTTHLSEIKQRRRNLYYTECKIEFNEEERATIRERKLYGHYLSFEHGYVNYPPSADGGIDPGHLKAASRLLLLVSLPFTYFAPPVALLCWIGAPGVFIYRKWIESVQRKSFAQTITIKQVMDAESFTICDLGNPLNAIIEQELKAVLETLKDLLTASATLPEQQTYEL